MRPKAWTSAQACHRDCRCSAAAALACLGCRQFPGQHASKTHATRLAPRHREGVVKHRMLSASCALLCSPNRRMQRICKVHLTSDVCTCEWVVRQRQGRVARRPWASQHAYLADGMYVVAGGTGSSEARGVGDCVARGFLQHMQTRCVLHTFERRRQRSELLRAHRTCLHSCNFVVTRDFVLFSQATCMVPGNAKYLRRAIKLLLCLCAVAIECALVHHIACVRGHSAVAAGGALV